MAFTKKEKENYYGYFPFEDFLDSLRNKGFSIDIDHYIIVAKLNNNLKEKDLTLNKIKFSLAASICRTKEEQNNFYNLFDDYINLYEKELNEKKEILSNEIKAIKIKQAKKKKEIILSLILSVSFFSLVIVCIFPVFKTDYRVNKMEMEKYSNYHFTLNDTLNKILPSSNSVSYQTLIEKLFKPKFDFPKTKRIWDLQDTIINNNEGFSYQFKKTGKKNLCFKTITATDTIEMKDSITICDQRPSIVLGTDSIYTNEKIWFSVDSDEENPNKLNPIIWKIENKDTITYFDRPFSDYGNYLDYTFKEKGRYKISCKYKNQFCPHDSINTISIDVRERKVEDEDKNKFTLENEEITKNPNYIYKSNTKLFYFLFTLLVIVISCCLLTLYIATIYNKYEKIMQQYFDKVKNNKIQEYLKNTQDKIFNGSKPPVDIVFENKDYHIKDKKLIRKLALELQKKITSNDPKLNFNKTITNSIKNHDLLTPVFENKEKKLTYLILIDLSYSKSPQISLFNFLIKQLEDNQVYTDYYYYFNNPTQVFKKNSDNATSIEKIKSKHNDSVLIVFSDGYNFLDSNFPELYTPFKNTFTYWSKRILITTVPSLDWSLNEKLLASFFNIVPADKSGLLDIFPMLLKGSYNQIVIYTKQYNDYKTKFIEFEDINELELYISDESVFQWLCALALYPKIYWEIILTIGNTIDQNKVNYYNLLKITRIDWIHQAYFPSRIRLELLKKLTLTNEIKVREALVKLLENQLKNDIDSFSHNEITMQLIINKFILFAYSPTEYAKYENEEKQFLKLYQEKMIKDIPLKIYLQGEDPEKQNEVWESTLGKKTKNNLEDYLKNKLGIPTEKENKKRIRNYLFYALSILVLPLLYLSYVGYKKPNNSIFIFNELILPNEWSITLRKDDCFNNFDPTKVKITTKGKTILEQNINNKTEILNLYGFENVYNKDIKIQFFSKDKQVLSDNFTISNHKNTFGILGNECISKSSVVNSFEKKLMEYSYDRILSNYNIEENQRFENYKVETTIDTFFQKISSYALQSQLEFYQADHGTVIIMETKTGKIKAMQNFGNNNILRNMIGIDRIKNPNYAIAESSEPGSIFKLVNLIALLDDNKIDTSKVYDSHNGIISFYGRKIRDAHQGGYGKISLAKAFEVSSNTVMAQAVHENYNKNPQQYVDRVNKMGLNKPLGVPFNDEGLPYVPQPTDAKWSKTSLPFMSFGYGVSITPLQTLTLYNAIANNGVMVKPIFATEISKDGKVVKTYKKEIINSKICSQQTIKKIKPILKNVIYKGNGAKLFSRNFSFAGKTGTALYDYHNNDEKMKYISSFVGFFPYEQPKYTCIVVIYDPKSSIGYYGADVAGPVFKRIAEKIIDKK